MLLKEIRMVNILGCASVRLRFDDNLCHVYVVQSEPTSPIRQALCLAIQLICSRKYAGISSLAHIKDIQKGYVHLTFLLPHSCAENGEVSASGDVEIEDETSEEYYNTPCTSREARERELRRQAYLKRRTEQAAAGAKNFYEVCAFRDFRTHPEHIEYNVDGGPQHICTMPSFHGKFCTNVDYVLPNLDQLTSGNCKGDWLQLISTELNDRWNRRENFGNPFTVFANLFLRKHYDSKHVLAQLTKSCLMSNLAMNVIQKTQALKVFKDVSSIFEYITCKDYTVWFMIPHRGKYINVNDVSTEELDFNQMETCIQLKSNDSSVKREFRWTESSHAMQDLLLIAFQLALAFNCKRSVIYLQKLDELKDHQALQLATAAALQSHGEKISWTSRNYLQHIIDICAKLGITAIIEYPGGLPMALKNAHLIKCYRVDGGDVWGMKLAENTSSSLDCFVDFIEGGWRETSSKT